MGYKTIVLADRKTVKENGKEKILKENSREYLVVFSNKALKYGIENGFLESTSLMDLMKRVEEDITLAWKIIYISFITTNDVSISYDDFIDRLDIDVSDVVWKAQSIMQPTLPEKYEEYLNEMMNATDEVKKK